MEGGEGLGRKGRKDLGEVCERVARCLLLNRETGKD
uniref:Uncharacterized protein n=1 Tax=Arundo donax TaxID=35708 RepID=A0A0A9EQ65_ARUDO